MILWHIKQSILVICVISNLPYSLRLQLIHFFNFWCYQITRQDMENSHFFRVKLYKKGKNMFPSQAYRPSRPIWIVKTWFKPIFSFNTTIFSLPRKNVLFISTRPKIHLSIWKWRVSLGPPRNLYLYFPKILKKEQFHIEKPEKNYNTMTYPPSVLSGNTNAKHQK